MLRRSLTVLHPAVEYARYQERIGRIRSGPPRARAGRGSACGGIIDASGCGVWVFCLLIERYNIKCIKSKTARHTCVVPFVRRGGLGGRRAERAAKFEARGRWAPGAGRARSQGGAGGQIASGPLPGARRRQHTRRTFSPSLHRFIFLSIEPPLPDLLADRPIPSVDLSPLPSPLLAVASASSMLKPPPSVEALAAIVRSIRAAIFLVSSYEVPNGGR